MNQLAYPEPIPYWTKLYIGIKCEEHICDAVLSKYNIDLILNLTGFDIRPSDFKANLSNINIENLGLYDSELMENETVRAIEKIKNISNIIYRAINASMTVLVVCKTGLNSGIFAAGYYSGMCLGWSSCDIIKYIKSISDKYGIKLLTNSSFKYIIHPRKRMSKDCVDCVPMEANYTKFDYRADINVEL